MSPLTAALLVVVFAGGTAAAKGRPLFGPGAHWIDEVTGGTAVFRSEAVVGVDLTFDGTSDLTVSLTGTTEVFRSGARTGDPAGDPGHKNHLDLEIVSMTLTGTHPDLGPVTLRMGDGVGNLARDGPLYSAGTSDEIAGSPALAADRFTLFFEVEALGLVLHNAEPFPVEAVIDRLPPIGSPFTIAGGPVPLLTTEGVPLLQITETVFRPLPPPEAACDPRGADAHAIAVARADVQATCNCEGVAAHVAYVRCSARLLKARVGSGQLNGRCKGQVQRCAASSTCGRPGSVTCVRSGAGGAVSCAVKKSRRHCKPPPGGAARVGESRSCCD